MEHEQNNGPLCHSKNSLYYETKFELMTKEIEDLRWQLHEKESDRRRSREDSGDSSSRMSRSLTLDGDRGDARRQLETVRQEADALRERLHQLEVDNRRTLVDGSVSAAAKGEGTATSLEETNKQLTSKVSLLEKRNADLLERLEKRGGDSSIASSSGQYKSITKLERDNGRLLSELNRLREAKPDFGKLHPSPSLSHIPHYY